MKNNYNFKVQSDLCIRKGMKLNMEEDFNIRPELESPIEEKIENSLRPQTLEEYIGQTKVKENMKIYI